MLRPEDGHISDLRRRLHAGVPLLQCAQGEAGAARSDEPRRVAEAAAQLGLSHVVITCVTRDDLPDGGAEHFAATIAEIRRA